MIGFDIILVAFLVLLVLTVVVIAVKNNAKIKKSNEKPAAAKEVVVPMPEEIKVEMEMANYLQDYFKQEAVVFEELHSGESTKETMFARKKISELDNSLKSAKTANENAYEVLTEDDFEEDYDVGLGDDEALPNSLKDEFNSLSHEMKGFIMSGALNDEFGITKTTNNTQSSSNEEK